MIIMLKKIMIAITIQISTYIVQYILYPLLNADPDLGIPFIIASSAIITFLWLHFKDIGIGYLIFSTPVFPILICIYHPNSIYGMGNDTFGLSWGLEFIVLWWIVFGVQISIFVICKIKKIKRTKRD